MDHLQNPVTCSKPCVSQWVMFMSTNMLFTNKVVQVLPPAASRTVLQYRYTQHWNLFALWNTWFFSQHLAESFDGLRGLKTLTEDQVLDRGHRSLGTCLCLWPRPPLLCLPALHHAASLFFTPVDPAHFLVFLLSEVVSLVCALFSYWRLIRWTSELSELFDYWLIYQ